MLPPLIDARLRYLNGRKMRVTGMKVVEDPQDYLNIEPMYLHGYACETAFRQDHRRVSSKNLTAKLFLWALNVGKSKF